jgi:hypothetical protein
MLKSKNYQKKLPPDSYIPFVVLHTAVFPLRLAQIFSINTHFLTAVISTKNKQLSAGRFFFEQLTNERPT